MSDDDQPIPPDEPELDGSEPPANIFPQCQDCGRRHARLSSGGNWRATCKGHKPQRDENGDPLYDLPFLPCAAYPVVGLTVCRSHGGGTAAAQAKSLEMQAVGAAAHLSNRLRLVSLDPQFIDQHPIEGLLEECARSAQAVAWLASQVEKLWVDDPEDYGTMAELAGFDDDGKPIYVPNRSKLLGVDHNNNLARHPLWIALEKERMLHAKLCSMAIQVGIEEKRINLQQAQASVVAKTLVTVLDGLGLDPDTTALAKMRVAEILRAGGPQAFLAMKHSIG